MTTKTEGSYEAPKITEYGSVESLTLDDKCGTGADNYSAGNPLTGSIVDNGEC